MWDQPKVKAFRESPLPLAFPEDRVALGENLDQAVRLGLKPEGALRKTPTPSPRRTSSGERRSTRASAPSATG